MNDNQHNLTLTTQQTPTSSQNSINPACLSKDHSNVAQTLPSADVPQPLPISSMTSGYVSLVLSFTVFTAILASQVS